RQLPPEAIPGAQPTARLLEPVGHRVEEAHPPALDEEETGLAVMTVISTWIARDLAFWSERTGRPIGARDVEPMIWSVEEQGRAVTGLQYVRAAEHLHGFARRLAHWREDGFALLLTT